MANPFLGAFVELRKATISVVTTVCPSFRMAQLGSQWKDFHLCVEFFFKTLPRILKFY